MLNLSTYCSKTLSTLVVLFFCLSASAQVGGGGIVTTGISPCDTFQLADGEMLQSSTLGARVAALARDAQKISTWSQTLEETNPYWQIDFGSERSIKGVQISWPALPDSNYYLLFFNELPESNSLSDLLATSGIRSLHIASAFANSTVYSLDTIQARYFRIQKSGFGSLSIGDIGINGRKEICGNGTDDDCDGKIDCNDVFDCGNFYSLTETKIKDPSCSICNDGEIFIYGSSYGCSSCSSYSINGGVTWQNNNQFSNLGAGDYNLRIRNNNSGCITEFPQTVVLRNLNLGGSSACPNGGFEDGNFGNWKAYVRQWSEQWVEVNPLQYPTRFGIISQLADPLTNGNLTLENDCNGNFIAKLGNSMNGTQQEKLEYEFVVDNFNKDFTFRLACVVEDPDHNPGENPFFSYEIVEKSTKALLKRDVFEHKDIRMRPGSKEPVKFLDWICVKVDLSALIGQTVVASFNSADCKKEQHFGYGYVDGLCSPVVPQAKLNVASVFCSDDPILADGTASWCESDHTWTICEIIDGLEVNCYSESVKSQVDEKVDIRQMYLRSGRSLIGGKKYRVKLRVFNDCNLGTVDQKDFDVIQSNGITYNNIFICNTTYSDISVSGTGNSNGYSYAWSPANLFVDRYQPFPKLKDNLPVGDYTAHVLIAKSGCLVTKTVRIIIVDPASVVVTKTEECLNYCKIRIALRFQFPFPINSSTLKLRWYNVEDNLTYFSDLVNVANNNNTLETAFVFDKNKVGALNLDVVMPNIVITGCSSFKTISTPKDHKYFGNINSPFVPNLFNPASAIFNNSQLFAFQSQIGYNSFWYKIEVFEQGGGRALSKEEYAPICGTPFPDQTIRWNGLLPCPNGPGTYWCDDMDQGISFPSQVFTYTILLANCEVPVANPKIIHGDITLTEPSGEPCLYKRCKN